MPLLTPRTSSRSELRVRGSRFLATALPIPDEEHARSERASLERAFPDATHHCWALRLHTPRGDRERHGDAGEPAGTAGWPILRAIRAAGVTNALVVVTRWFGGTRLGRGGLARAYRDAAQAALAQAGVIHSEPLLRLILRGGVASDGEVRHLIARCAGRIESATYDEPDVVRLTIALPEPAVDRVRQTIAHLTRGSWSVDVHG